MACCAGLQAVGAEGTAACASGPVRAPITDVPANAAAALAPRGGVSIQPAERVAQLGSLQAALLLGGQRSIQVGRAPLKPPLLRLQGAARPHTTCGHQAQCVKAGRPTGACLLTHESRAHPTFSAYAHCCGLAARTATSARMRAGGVARRTCVWRPCNDVHRGACTHLEGCLLQLLVQLRDGLQASLHLRTVRACVCTAGERVCPA
jgi:hypothetical protein